MDKRPRPPARRNAKCGETGKEERRTGKIQVLLSDRQGTSLVRGRWSFHALDSKEINGRRGEKGGDDAHSRVANPTEETIATPKGKGETAGLDPPVYGRIVFLRGLDAERKTKLSKERLSGRSALEDILRKGGGDRKFGA